MQADSNFANMLPMHRHFMFAFALACVPIGESSEAGETSTTGSEDRSDVPSPTTGGETAALPQTDPGSETGGGGTSEGDGSGGWGQCDDVIPEEGQPWGPCRDETPDDPQWTNRCDGGIFCTQVDKVGTICLPPCAFPVDDPADGSCPCGAPGGEGSCDPLTNPSRPERPCRVTGKCPEGMSETDWAGCVWTAQGLGGGPAEPPPPDPSCGVWPPEAGQPWGPCLAGFSCVAGSVCRVADGGESICEPSCDGPEITDCPGNGCYGYPAELFCTGKAIGCEMLCTWGPGDTEGSCPAGMVCDASSRCAWT